MAPESDSNLRFEIGHVLFVDLVGYSKLLIEEQKERLGQLTRAMAVSPLIPTLLRLDPLRSDARVRLIGKAGLTAGFLPS